MTGFGRLSHSPLGLRPRMYDPGCVKTQTEPLKLQHSNPLRGWRESSLRNRESA